MSNLTNKTIVITGAASGLGKAWVEGFHAEGARIVAADVNKDGLDSLPEGIITIETDVSEKADVDAMIDLAMSETGQVDVLFNNAGYGLPFALEDFPEGAFEQLVAVHLFGALYGMQKVIPIMRKQGTGHIVNTISRHAEASAPNASAYSAAKAGLWTISRSTAKEVAGSGILVNMLIPGPTNTGIWGKDMSDMQPPEATYPTARMLALFESDDTSGEIFWDEKTYRLYESLYN